MVKKMVAKQKIVEPEVVEEQEEVVQEQPKSNVKKLVKKEVPVPETKKAPVTPPKGTKPGPTVTGPNQISLKDLCVELKMDPTAARVKLRKAFGAKGLRYVWDKGSEELAKVRTILTTKAAPAVKTAKKTKKVTKAVEPEVVEPDVEEQDDGSGDPDTEEDPDSEEGEEAEEGDEEAQEVDPE